MNGKKIKLPLTAFLLSPVLLSPVMLGAAQPQDVPAYKNTNLSFEERAHDLEQRMTLEEKVSQLGHTADAIGRLEIPEYNWWNEGLHGVARAGVATVFPQTIGMAATFDDALLGRDAEAISTEFRAKYNVNRGKNGSSVWYKGLSVVAEHQHFSRPALGAWARDIRGRSVSDISNGPRFRKRTT